MLYSREQGYHLPKNQKLERRRMKEAVIVDACRSPIGRAGDRGVYRAIGFIDLMVPVLKGIIERNKLDPNLIDEIVIGSAALGGTMSRNITEAPFTRTYWEAVIFAT